MTTRPGAPIPVRLAWASPYAAPTVFLATGEDEQVVTAAERVTIDCVVGEPPKVFLEFTGDQSAQDIKLEGVVHTVREIPADPLKVVDEFLSNIDSGELQRAVLESMEMGDGDSTFGDAALRVLRGWARGD